MEVFIFTFIFFTVACLLMSLGVLSGRKPISGSCGGIGGLSDGCEICGGSKIKCDEESRKLAAKLSSTPRISADEVSKEI